MPASRITASHFATSSAIHLAAVSGVVSLRTVMVRSDRRFCTLSMAATRLKAALIACTAGSGVPAAQQVGHPGRGAAVWDVVHLEAAGALQEQLRRQVDGAAVAAAAVVVL